MTTTKRYLLKLRLCCIGKNTEYLDYGSPCWLDKGRAFCCIICIYTHLCLSNSFKHFFLTMPIKLWMDGWMDGWYIHRYRTYRHIDI